MDPCGRLVALGRVRSHRGGAGEITIRVPFGDAEFWVGVARVILDRPDRGTGVYAVEHARAYRDRLVLKLHGVDDASAAARLSGALVQAEAAHAHEVASGRFHPALAVGLVARDESGCELGRVVGVERTGGSPLLVIERSGPDRGARREVLLPAVAPLVGPIDECAGTVIVRPPEGLLELGTEEDGRR